MKVFRTVLLSAALLGCISLVATAQDWDRDRDHDRDRDRDRQSGWYNNNGYNNQAAYQQGLHDGREDSQHNRVKDHHRKWNGNDRAAYDAGYRAGQQSAYRNGRYYPNGGYYPNQPVYNGPYNNGPYNNGPYNNGPYNNGPYYGNGGYYGNNGMQVAQQYGYQDGVNEGSNDRATGHSFRPTHDRGYQLATNGYQPQFGSKQQYQQWYRQAYEQGYNRGYNSNMPPPAGWHR
jgi:hypothetical protein